MDSLNATKARGASADPEKEDVDLEKVKKDPSAYKVLTKAEYDNLIHLSLQKPAGVPNRFKFPYSYTPRASTPAGMSPISPMQNLMSAFRPNASFLTPTYNPPRLPVFSGTEDNQSTSYEVWNFEVKCLMKSKQYPEFLLQQAIRNSLRGTARNMLVSLGENANVEDILKKLDGFYGNVNTSETLMHSFYNDEQGNESAVVYGSRLEETLSRALRGRSDLLPAKDIMLKSKFWSGLKKNLKESTRHLHDSLGDFQTLLKEGRKVEQEVSLLKSSDSNRTVQVSQQTQVEGSEIQQILKTVKGLSSRMENMESKILSLQRDMKNKLTFRERNVENSPNRNHRGSGFQQRGGHPFRGRGRGRATDGNRGGGVNVQNDQHIDPSSSDPSQQQLNH